MWDLVYALGRVAVAPLFILSGFGKLTNIAGTAQAIAGKGLPYAQIFAVGSGLLELIAGILIVLGLKTRWCALLLAIFTAVATYYFHNFWDLDGAARNAQQIQALKNLAALGALLMLAAAGPGRFAVDSRP
jgi:putative oxidoreductase